MQGKKLNQHTDSNSDIDASGGYRTVQKHGSKNHLTLTAHEVMALKNAKLLNSDHEKQKEFLKSKGFKNNSNLL